MKTESVEEFLARGGKIQKSKNEVTLDQLLLNEGLLDKDDAQLAKKQLNEGLEKMLSGLNTENKKK